MNRFSIIETFHNYRLVDDITNRSIDMGDGHNQDFRNWDTLSALLYNDYEGRLGMNDAIGTEAFRQAWEDHVNENEYEYFQACFPNLDRLEIWRDDGWTTVFTGTKTGKYPDVLVITDQFHASEFDVAIPGPHLGHQVHFLTLPQKIQRHIAERLEE